MSSDWKTDINTIITKTITLQYNFHFINEDHHRYEQQFAPTYYCITTFDCDLLFFFCEKNM
jgi:hypothetical protein